MFPPRLPHAILPPAILPPGGRGSVMEYSTDRRRDAMPAAEGAIPGCQGENGAGMKRSRVGEVLLSEELKWRREETWFGARMDPQFARKRERSSAFTPPRPRAASSASTVFQPNYAACLNLIE